MAGTWNRLTTSQVADMAGVSRQAITDARKAGQFPTAFKAGRDWSYSKDEAAAYVAYREHKEFEDEIEEVE